MGNKNKIPDTLPKGVLIREDGSYITEDNYKNSLKHMEPGPWLVTEPCEIYNELLRKVGVNCKANIILAYIHLTNDTRTINTPYCNGNKIDEINIYYKGTGISQKFTNWPTPTINNGKGEKSQDYFTEIVLDFINKQSISNISNNEYIRYIFGLTWDFNNRLGDPNIVKGIFKIVLVEYNNEFLNSMDNLDFYNNVKAGITDWDFDPTSNYVEDELIKQGRRILNGYINNEYDLYDRIHNLSLLKYEGQENKGKILFCNHHYLDETFIRFKDNIRLSDNRNLRTIRKLFEISTGNVFLLCDGLNIYGIGKISTEKILNKKAFLINFRGTGKWNLENISNGNIMNVSYGVASLPKQEMNEKEFFKECIRTFGELGYSNQLWNFINEAQKQRHGTMIVVTDKADVESERLNKNSFTIVPTDINDLELVYGLTSIDGAVMLNPFGRCYSIGCILDGTTEKNIGDSSRGARYNSALRYIHYCMNKQYRVLVIVVSEDGMINVLTKDDILTK